MTRNTQENGFMVLNRAGKEKKKIWRDKMNYVIPTMKEIEELTWNGYKVISTFSGGGGSCLGYRMAGYKVIYANEFVEEARNTYKKNHHNSYMDDRDIRDVTAEDILEILNLKKGEIDIFEGSPPCCAFSNLGLIDKGWGQERKYSDGKRQRIDDLFFEYIRILYGLQPKVFVAENVQGLTRGKSRIYLFKVLELMEKCGYEVEAMVMDAKNYGVPQSRKRCIFMGVRKDLVEKYDVHPTFPQPQGTLFTVKDALEGIEDDEEERQMLLERAKRYSWYNILIQIPKNPPKKLDGPSVLGKRSYFNLIRECMHQPCSTIVQRSSELSTASSCHPLEDRKFTIKELKRIMSVPNDFILTGNYQKQGERLGRMVPPLMVKAIAKNIQINILDKIR